MRTKPKFARILNDLGCRNCKFVTSEIRLSVVENGSDRTQRRRLSERWTPSNTCKSTAQNLRGLHLDYYHEGSDLEDEAVLCWHSPRLGTRTEISNAPDLF